jgi:hypothetical protein
MLQAIKKEVTVLQGGRIEFSSPELKPGARAEVIVLIQDSQTIAPNLTSFIGKGKGAFKKPTEVDEFLRKERDKWE